MKLFTKVSGQRINTATTKTILSVEELLQIKGGDGDNGLGVVVK